LLLLPAALAAPALAASASPTAAPPSDSLAACIAAAGDSSRWEGAGAVLVFDRTTVDLEPTGLGHVRRRALVKILTEGGAREQATQRFDYDPASNLIRIEKLVIHRGDGSLEPVDPASAVDLPAPADMIYWGARMKILSIPRLAIGDAIELVTYKKGFQIAYLDGAAREAEGGAGGEDASAGTSEEDVSGRASGAGPSVATSMAQGVEVADDEKYLPPMRGHFYDVVTFQESLPIVEKSYTLRTPRDKPVQYATYNGALRSSLTFADSLLVYSWEARDVPAFVEEPRIPERTDIVPKVVLATVESWQEKSRWFFEINDPVFASDEGIRAKVDQLTRGLQSDDEKMAVLLHWVAQEIRYAGLSMGKGEGYTLHPGTMTYADRCGVCKDIAGMLVTMLRAAGFSTYPAMTMAGARVEAIPADQFNHCVVAVERPDGSYTMLDPTWAPFDRATWSRFEGEQHYVIGSPRGEGLSRIRSFSPEESRLRVDAVSRLHADGTLEGRLDLLGQGASDSRLRGLLSDAPAADFDGAIADLLASLGPAIEIVSVEACDPRDFSRDASIRIDFRVPSYASAGDSLLAFLPPAARVVSEQPRLCRMLSFGEGEEGRSERKSEALLWFSQELLATDRITLPPGFRCSGPLDTLRVDHDAASLAARYLPGGGSARTELRAVTRKRTIPASEWAGGSEAVDSLRAFAE
ncbi:MAG: DUF3857 and transglutaminase domain-containing protein, partial [Candidatus Eisenbacteria bacterium]|nr:DUF3857 and transglutaminase domain-containing protein [Candidatus Eisenbacteria bacterium]